MNTSQKVSKAIDDMQDDPLPANANPGEYTQGWNDAISIVEILLEDVTPPKLKHKWLEFLVAMKREKDNGNL